VKFKKGDRVLHTRTKTIDPRVYRVAVVDGSGLVFEGYENLGAFPEEYYEKADPAVCYGKSPVETALGDIKALEKLVLPTGSASRKDIPLARGVLDYFPAALAEVAKLSKAGNDKHNPGEEMHHARSKSSDHADCIIRHLMERGTDDPEDGIPHIVKVAWRALALCQEELEERKGAPMARGARL